MLCSLINNTMSVRGEGVNLAVDKARLVAVGRLRSYRPPTRQPARLSLPTSGSSRPNQSIRAVNIGNKLSDRYSVPFSTVFSSCGRAHGWETVETKIPMQGLFQLSRGRIGSVPQFQIYPWSLVPCTAEMHRGCDLMARRNSGAGRLSRARSAPSSRRSKSSPPSGAAQ